MLDRFIRHVRESHLLDESKYYLLAISGGIDSMALAYLLKRSNIPFGLVHCNFQLRGEESEEDERFIREFAESIQARVLVKRFDVNAYKRQHGVSTQMAARELRYGWFDELLDQKEGEAILVAHHAGDQLETILLNLLRGTGIEGIYGMAERRGGIIRPLLPFTRIEIADLVSKEGIVWREDSSNELSDYKRNFLRHEILAPLEDHFHRASDSLSSSFGRIKDVGQAFFVFYEEWRKVNVNKEGENEYLSVEAFRNHSGRASVLFYWLRGFGFNYAQIEEILASVDRGMVGRLFESGRFMLNVDREYLILGPKKASNKEAYLDSHSVSLELGDVRYDILHLKRQSIMLDKSSSNVMLDKDSLAFPLKIRNWQEGDKFRPLGMKGFKKVSDFLIDLKVPLIHKRNVKVLCSGDEIAWIVGLRVDDRFKVGAYTENIMYIKQK